MMAFIRAMGCLERGERFFFNLAKNTIFKKFPCEMCQGYILRSRRELQLIEIRMVITINLLLDFPQNNTMQNFRL